MWSLLISKRIDGSKPVTHKVSGEARHTRLSKGEIAFQEALGRGSLAALNIPRRKDRLTEPNVSDITPVDVAIKIARSDRPRHMSQLIAWGLRDILAKYEDSFVFGEDVAKKGGVYYLTAGLLDAFGRSRVFNTLLDETTILGIALGAGLMGYLPIPEIQYRPTAADVAQRVPTGSW